MSAPAASYSNLALVRPNRRTTTAIKAEASAQQKAEARLKRKIDQAARVLNRLETRAATYKLQITALQQRQAATLARMETLEEQILRELQDAGLSTVHGFRSELIAHPCPYSLVVEDEALIPDEWMRTPPPPKKQPDKVAIKVQLAKNEKLPPDQVVEIPGVRLVQNISLVRK